MSVYQDLLISSDEIALDDAGNPVVIYDRDVIAQDIRHMIRESALLEQLIGERSQTIQGLIFKKLKMLIEQDARVIPGTSDVQVIKYGELRITAESEFGPINTVATV